MMAAHRGGSHETCRRSRRGPRRRLHPPERRQPATVQRMYVLNCGESVTTDISRWSPGVNVGQTGEFGNNCYLIRHAKGWMLWDSGFSDAVAAMPDGLVAAGGALRAKLPKTLVSQLAEVGVKPADISYIAFSHFHPDHSGNANLFTNATLVHPGDGIRGDLRPDAAEVRLQSGDLREAPREPGGQAEGRLRRVRRRLGDDPLDARAHAGAPVAAGPVAEDGRRDPLRRPDAFSGELGQPPRAGHELQQRPDHGEHGPGQRRSS